MMSRTVQGDKTAYFRKHTVGFGVPCPDPVILPWDLSQRRLGAQTGRCLVWREGHMSQLRWTLLEGSETVMTTPVETDSWA